MLAPLHDTPAQRCHSTCWMNTLISQIISSNQHNTVYGTSLLDELIHVSDTYSHSCRRGKARQNSHYSNNNY